jgi:Protein of unknown function (DUF2442)
MSSSNGYDDCERPVQAWCAPDSLHVRLADGREIVTPLWWYPRLATATPAQRNIVELMRDGVHWPEVDEDLSVRGMLTGWKYPDAMEPRNAALSSETASEVERLNATDELILSAGRPLMEEELKSDSTSRRPEGWLEIRTEILDVVKWRHLNDLAINELADFDYDSFFAASDSLLDFGEIIWFARTRNWPSDLHEGYLWLVGTLQSLTVLRDATIQFSKCLGVENIECADVLFAEANELRIAAIGHPTSHKRNRVPGATFLTRTMKRPGLFEIGTYPNNGRFISRSIDMHSLIANTEHASTIYMRHCHNALARIEIFDTPNWQCFHGDGINK